MYIFILFYVMNSFPTCVYVHHMRKLPKDARRGLQIWNWYYRRFWATLRVMGNVPGSSRRASCPLKCWATFLDPNLALFSFLLCSLAMLPDFSFLICIFLKAWKNKKICSNFQAKILKFFVCSKSTIFWRLFFTHAYRFEMLICMDIIFTLLSQKWFIMSQKMSKKKSDMDLTMLKPCWILRFCVSVW